MKALVLAGGFGLRLRERVADLPKVMAPVAGRPFLEYVLDQLIAGQLSEIVISIGYRADAILAHFGDTYRGIKLSYAQEIEPLGTGGATLNSLKTNEPTVVVNGDSLLDIDYHEFVQWYSKRTESLAVVLRSVSDVARYGSVEVQGDRIIAFSEKGRVGPGLVSAGIYVLRRSLLTDFGLSGKFSLETDLLQKHCNAIKPRAFITNGFFIDIGVPSDYDRAQYEFVKRKIGHR